jgi:hypothetical protein
MWNLFFKKASKDWLLRAFPIWQVFLRHFFLLTIGESIIRLDPNRKQSRERGLGQQLGICTKFSALGFPWSNVSFLLSQDIANYGWHVLPQSEGACLSFFSGPNGYHHSPHSPGTACASIKMDTGSFLPSFQVKWRPVTEMVHSLKQSSVGISYQ